MTDLAVLMAVYKNDNLKYFRLATESILNQTFRDFHFYILRNGQVSSEIEEYLNSFQDDRIVLYRFDENRGLARALNYMLEIVLKNPEYEFIARMDADDISYLTRFEKQRSFLLEHDNISCVGSWYEEIDKNDRHLSFKKLPIDHESLKQRYMTRTPFAHSSVMYSRKLIEKAGYYPENTILMEDNVLWGSALKSGLLFANVPEYLLMFRINNSFYKRRAGVKYGYNYINNRIRINRSLKFPYYVNLLTVLIGSIKMMPGCCQKFIYRISVNF